MGNAVTMTVDTPPAAAGRLIKLSGRTVGWRDEKGASSPPPMVTGRPNKEMLKVLLVEDEPGDARLVEYALRMSNAPIFQVKHVSTLSAAIAHIQSDETVDVVLLDLSLPDSSGISTVSRMQEAASKTPIVIMTGMDDPRFAAYALEAGAQDYLIKTDDPEKTVSRAIRYAITRMASQIERQALLERIAEQQRRLVEEVEAARAMQFDLLPRPERVDLRLAALGIEVESFFEPSSGIGGDLWGCLDCGGGRMSFYCFDFTGHGIGAALNVFRLHALISDHWDPRRPVGEILQLLGSSLRGLLGRGQFATMFLCTVDCERNELEWASAGAPAPLLINDHSGEFRFLDARGVPLGLSKAPHYTEHREAFPPGSSLLMYSDAITDAPMSDDLMLAEAGLTQLVSDAMAEHGGLRVADLIDRLYATVRTPLEDDLTAVCIRRLGERADSPPPATTDLPSLRQDAGTAPMLVVGQTISPDLDAQCRVLGLVATAAAPTAGRRSMIAAGEATTDAIERGLAPPYAGFIELGPEGLLGAGLRCFDTVRAGGISLSVRTDSAYRLNVTELIATAIRRSFAIAPGEPSELMEICLAEAIGNAVIHGNLGIPSHLRTSAKGLGNFRRLTQERLADPALAGRRLEINVCARGAEAVTIAVSDQGRGFDLKGHLHRDPCADAKSGRGLGLIHKICKSVLGEDDGRTLIMTFSR